MANPELNKKRIVTSYHNLTAEQQEELKRIYPAGFADAMMRIDKPNGDFFYVVPFETDDVYYLVKIDVKVDDPAQAEEEIEKDFYTDEDGGDIKGAEDIQDNGGGSDDDE